MCGLPAVDVTLVFEHCILICHMSYYNYNCNLYCAIFYLNIIRFFSNFLFLLIYLPPRFLLSLFTF